MLEDKKTEPGLLVLPVNSITPDPHNENTHPEEEIIALVWALRTLGQQQAIVVDADNVCIAGNAVLKAAKRLKWKTIEAKRSLLKGMDRAGYKIEDNTTRKLREWDFEVTRENLKGIRRSLGREFDPLVLGFTADDLTHLLSSASSAPASTADGTERAHSTIKVMNVKPKDKGRILRIVASALEGTPYEARVY